MKLTGRIWRLGSGFAFARTPVGTLTLFSKEGLREVKASPWATVWTHGRNIVVDIFTQGEPTPRHRFITAVPVYESPDRTTLTLWTPEGGMPVDLTQAGSRLSSLEDGMPVTVRLDRSGKIAGTPVTIQLNSSGEVIDVRKAG